MKKLFIIAFAAMVAMNVSAQMNVWENGGLAAQYAVENVDSVTFGITSATPESGTGKDGITPLLKIENDYWFISYDEGVTWQQEGKAKGDQGEQGIQGEVGPRGEKGDKGDSMFQAVTQDSNFVYLTLLDSTIVKLVKAKETSNNDQPNSDFIFTITYDPNGGEGIAIVDTFYYGYTAVIEDCIFTKNGYHFVGWNTKSDGTGAMYYCGFEMLISKDIPLYAQWDNSTTGFENGYEWVDLGLSVKWAACNVGATKPEQYGNLYAWGDTQPDRFNRDYIWSKSPEQYTTYTKYTDGNAQLELSDDAARGNWEGAWRMPTYQEMQELKEKCLWAWTTLNGTKGYQVISKSNGNSIFLPAAGYNNGYASEYGYYFSASQYSEWEGYVIKFTSSNILITRLSRYFGASIRPVRP